MAEVINDDNGQGTPINLITEKGAFGVPGLMCIVRNWIPEAEREGDKALSVESYVIAPQGPVLDVEMDDIKKEQMNEARRLKAKRVEDPTFASFTILEFVEETRKVDEPKENSKIVIPNFRETRKHSRSKYNADGSLKDDADGKA